MKQVEVQRMEYILYSSDSNTVHIRQPENPAATIAIIKDSPTSFPQIPTPCSSNWNTTGQEGLHNDTYCMSYIFKYFKFCRFPCFQTDTILITRLAGLWDNSSLIGWSVRQLFSDWLECETTLLWLAGVWDNYFLIGKNVTKLVSDWTASLVWLAGVWDNSSLIGWSARQLFSDWLECDTNLLW